MDVSNYFSEEDIKTLDKCLSYASGRKMIISRISREHDHNWQCVETPHHVCSEMFDLIPEDVENYIIFFALEFLEVLIKERGFDGSKVIFVADNQLEADVAFELYGVKDVVYSKQEVNGRVIKKIVEDSGMKFGKVAVVGNPPYQQQSEAQKNRAGNGGKRQAKPIYHLFTEAVIDYLNPDYFSFIIPSRWMIGGMGLDGFRNRIRLDKSIKIIIDNMSCNGIFSNVDIAGGVCYFLRDKNYNGECCFNKTNRFLDEEDIIIRENESRSILSKIKTITTKYIGSKVSSCRPFGISTSVAPLDEGVPCWFKQSIGKKFVDKNIIIDQRKDLNKWKVLVPRSPIAGQTDFTKPIGFFTNKSIVISEPGEVCTETYLVVKSFNSKEDAENFCSYIRTKFFRFMLRLRVISQDLTKDCYNWVPDLDDWSKSWTDEELHKMFNLTNEEIRCIENKIKTI
jgi:hypothetical protein